MLKLAPQLQPPSAWGFPTTRNADRISSVWKSELGHHQQLSVLGEKELASNQITVPFTVDCHLKWPRQCTQARWCRPRPWPLPAPAARRPPATRVHPPPTQSYIGTRSSRRPVHCINLRSTERDVKLAHLHGDPQPALLPCDLVEPCHGAVRDDKLARAAALLRSRRARCAPHPGQGGTGPGQGDHPPPQQSGRLLPCHSQTAQTSVMKTVCVCCTS